MHAHTPVCEASSEFSQARTRYCDVHWNDFFLMSTNVEQFGLRLCSFVGILEDISWKKEAEESLRRSEERYVLAVRGSNDGLWDWDMVTNQVFYSQRYKHMLGLGATEVDDSFGVFESRLHPNHHGQCSNLFALFAFSAANSHTHGFVSTRKSFQRILRLCKR